MTMRTWGRRLGEGCFVTAILVACGPGLGGGGGGMGGAGSFLGNAACPEMANGSAANASFEADAHANATLQAFVSAAGDLQATASKIEGEVAAACERMGADLGVPPAQMQPQQGQSKVQAACGAVSARMDAILQAGASASVKASFTPPECRVNADVAASCRGQCNANVDPGDAQLNCEPGHLYGKCDATCSGGCDGTCQGTCEGQCAGAADAKAATGAGAAGNANGQCNGQCKGTCRGSCSADCHGGCSASFKAPKCDLQARGPSASGSCEGSCKAKANITAQCTEPKVSVQANVNTGEMGALTRTLEANLPVLIKAQIGYGKRLAGDIDALVRTGAELPTALGHVAAHTGACIAAAANACLQAQASISVSVQASASVSGKAGASGGV
jgi:modification target Cys-rich repeat protein